MSEQNKPSRDAIALKHMAHVMAKQRVHLLLHLAEQFDNCSRSCAGEPAGSLAMLEEIQTIAQLIHDYATQQLMEQCAPKKEDE